MSSSTQMTQGYVTDVDYTWGAYPLQAPKEMALAAAMNGLAPVRPDGPFVYADLGCGNGLSVNLLAAANPQARFIGIDFNERHIANARGFADAAGLGNVEFHCLDFAGAVETALPLFDYVALHGVYTWVPHEVRAAILVLLRRRLAPDGLAYLAYNTMPGWAPIEPLRQMIIAYSEFAEGSTVDKARHALGVLRALRDNGALFFKANPLAGARLDELLKQPLSYVAHEYLNAAWEPLYFPRMVREMQLGGCAYAGSLPLLANAIELQLPPILIQAMGSTANRLAQEACKDLVLNQQFRVDIFAKRDTMPARQMNWGWLAEQRLVRRGEAGNDGPTVQIGHTRFDLSAPLFAQVLQAIGESAPTLGEIAGQLTAADIPAVRVLEAVQTLLVAQVLEIAVAAPPAAEPGLPRLVTVPLPANERVLRAIGPKAATTTMASPVTGGLVTLDLPQLLLLEGHTLGVTTETQPARLKTRLAEVGRRLASATGEPLSGQAEEEAAQQAWAGYRANLYARLCRLGIVTPA